MDNKPPLRLTLKRRLTDEWCENNLKGKYLDASHYDTLITEDTDAYDANGILLLKFRKGVVPYDILRSGHLAFIDSVEVTTGRGISSGSSHKRIRNDGSISNTTIGNPVNSGIVGFMDPNAMIHYCRKTAYTREHFKKFQAGIPFVKKIDELYKQLVPEKYNIQAAIARGTNRNYVIEGTCFTTVTVNKNFRTAVHKDAGDLPQGFGNLCVYREGHYEGSYFCLPEYGVAVDMQNTDILFVDVHKWHGNTPYVNESPDYLRNSFVMYYRELVYNCKQPAEELRRIQNLELGYMRL